MVEEVSFTVAVPPFMVLRVRVSPEIAVMVPRVPWKLPRPPPKPRSPRCCCEGGCCWSCDWGGCSDCAQAMVLLSKRRPKNLRVMKTPYVVLPETGEFHLNF